MLRSDDAGVAGVRSPERPMVPHGSALAGSPRPPASSDDACAPRLALGQCLSRERKGGRLRRRAPSGHHAHGCATFELHALWIRMCTRTGRSVNSEHRQIDSRFSKRSSKNSAQLVRGGEVGITLLRQRYNRDTCPATIFGRHHPARPAFDDTRHPGLRPVTAGPGGRARVRDRGRERSRCPRARPAAGGRAGSCPWRP